MMCTYIMVRHLMVHISRDELEDPRKKQPFPRLPADPEDSVMCTEFAIHDWGGVHSTEAMIEANRQFLDIVIPWLESTEWVAGYAFYPWFSSAPLWEGSPPTPTAMAYEHTGVIRSGEIYDIAGTNHGEHVAFLDGGRLTNTGAVGTALRYINALSGRSMIRGTLDWGLEPGGWMRVQPGATLRKVDSFGLSLDGGSLWNAGVIEIDDGTISVDRPVTGDGRITIGTYGNSTVASLELADSAIVSNSIGFRGRHTDTPAIVNTSGEGIVSGTMTIEVGGVDYILRSQAGSLTLAGARSIEAPPNMGDRLITLDGAGDGAVRGTITDEPGSTVSILKAGEGTWMLAAQNDYAGSTTVASGTLALEGRTGTGLTTIETGAILTGGGVVRGDLLAASGSTLRIGAEGLEPSSSSLLAQVDGFENYPLGPIGAVPNTTGDAWTGVFDGTGYAEIVENSGNRALAVHGLGGLDWRGAIADLSAHPISGNASLASGEVGTYFLRLRRNEPGAVYAVLGLTDLPASIASPPGNNTSTPYNDYAVTLTLIGTESGTLLRAFSEGAGNIPVTTVLDGEWLNLWLVVDNASKTFRVATSTGTDPGVDTGTEFNFGQRTGPEVGTSPIRTIGIHEGRGIFVEVDDLHFTEGEVLTNPLDADELRGEILTVQGDATLAPGSRVRVDIGDSGTSDRLSVQGALQLGGELEVSLDPSASINAGDRYDILDFSSVSGSFDVLSLPALPSGLAWDTTSLLVDGDLVAAGGCGPADIAVPYGQLDLADISAFVASFISSDPVADLDGNGVFDLADLSGFIAAFTAGCP